MLKKLLRTWLGIDAISQIQIRDQQDIRSLAQTLVDVDSELEEMRHLQDKYTLPGDLIKKVIELQKAMQELADE